MKNKVRYSIVLPTYNHCEDLLKPCLESITKYTDKETEVIVVANGCTDNTLEYLHSLTDINLRVIWVDEPLGYTKATNLGIKQAQGEYIVLLNNDTVLLPQPVNYWLELLNAPFVDPKTGITGPVKFDWDCGGRQYQCMAFWLVMIRREVFEKISESSSGKTFSEESCQKMSEAKRGLNRGPYKKAGK